MEKIRRPFFTSVRQHDGKITLVGISCDVKKLGYRLLTFGTVALLWHLAAGHYDNQLVLPTPWQTVKAFVFAIQDGETLTNLMITLQRVMTGLGIALCVGLTLGFAMGYSATVNQLIDPLIGPLRQVPIMAWVPLTIVWFGLGDGPTLFLIAMVATFPILLNTMAGVTSVPRNYYDAARSMGAGRLAIFSRVTLPSALPDIITGLRIGLSAGWMSVI